MERNEENQSVFSSDLARSVEWFSDCQRCGWLKHLDEWAPKSWVMIQQLEVQQGHAGPLNSEDVMLEHLVRETAAELIKVAFGS